MEREQSEEGGRNKNYRKVFKPNAPSNINGANERESVENVNDLVLGGGMSS